MKHRAGGRFGVAARGCHLHLREEGHGENGATERCQGDFGEGRNVLEQLDWRTVGAAEGKGMEKGGERDGEPLWPSCHEVAPAPNIHFGQSRTSPIPRGEPGQPRGGVERGAGAAGSVPGLCRRRGPAGCGGSGGSKRQSLTQQRPAGVALPDSVGSFNRRKRNSLYVTVTLLIVSVLILTVGLAATTRTQNVTVGGYYPGVILGFGSFLGIIGSNLIENKRQMLVASIIFISFGVIAAFCCAIVDGVFAARHIDLRPLYAGRCQYYSKSTTPPEAVCHPQRHAPCTPKIKTNTCFCCDLYNCGNRVEISGGYYEYIDVSSCQDIIHLYHLLWSATILNIVGLFLGIITAAILGGFKDMIPSLPTLNCAVENAHPSVNYYSRPQVTSYNSYYHSTPHLPPYSTYDFQHSSVFPASTPSGLSDDPQSLSPSPSYMWAANVLPRYSPRYFPPFEKPSPYTP
ncbi:transmembrane protein 255A-like [Hirundo rustica]|uniref:transmembrane protein 255A-like n=1 Tax=Hirundo rustica TaxID=43150 RepID=UPI001A941F18|nr:transmembrane protein 255A-like [Hirundo rustica]